MSWIEEIPDERLAAIIGSSCAAEKVIAERDRRRADGEDAVLYWDARRRILFVWPRIEEGSSQ